MDEGLRKAYTYKLTPTPDQERQLKDVVWRCRTLYNTALAQRITVDRQRGVTRTGSQQHAEHPLCFSQGSAKMGSVFRR